jgi:hypothetical protein
VTRPPPTGDEIPFVDMLHWCICVMQADDPDLSFTASLLYQTIERGGLTPRQQPWARRIFDKFEALHRAGDLDG